MIKLKAKATVYNKNDIQKMMNLTHDFINFENRSTINLKYKHY